LVLAVVAALIGVCPGSWAAEPAKPINTADNVKVRLVAARNSQERTHHLVLKCETLDKDRREIMVEFPTGDYTPPDLTLIAVLCTAMGWERSVSHSRWEEPKMEAIFSVPKDGVGTSGNLANCYLISLKPKENK